MMRALVLFIVWSAAQASSLASSSSSSVPDYDPADSEVYQKFINLETEQMSPEEYQRLILQHANEVAAKLAESNPRGELLARAEADRTQAEREAKLEAMKAEGFKEYVADETDQAPLDLPDPSAASTENLISALMFKQEYLERENEALRKDHRDLAKQIKQLLAMQFSKAQPTDNQPNEAENMNEVEVNHRKLKSISSKPMDTTGFVSVLLQTDKSKISFGKNSDVNIIRTGPKKLRVESHIDMNQYAMVFNPGNMIQASPDGGVVVSGGLHAGGMNIVSELKKLKNKIVVCGDGVRGATEECDDGNLDIGDGCSDTCKLEEDFICAGKTPDKCTPHCKAQAIQGDCGGNDSGGHGTQPNEEACRQKCASIDSCNYYVYWSENKMCYPKHTCSYSTNTNAKAQAYQLDCVHCKAHAVVGDCGGSDSGGHGTQPNLMACKNKCQTTAGCKYYVWWPATKMCYPKYQCLTTNKNAKAQTYRMEKCSHCVAIAKKGDCGGQDSGGHGVQPNLQACRLKCENQMSCNFYVWWPKNKMCYPKHHCSTISNANAVAQTYDLQMCRSDHCKTHWKAGDCGGNDSGGHGVQPNLAACKEKCKTIPTCKYYVWWPSNRMCYPKHTCAAINTNTKAQTYTLESDCNTHCEVKQVAGDCGGNDSGNHGVQPSLAACKERCRTTKGCKYYVFWPGNMMCYPKHTCTSSTGNVGKAVAYELASNC